MNSFRLLLQTLHPRIWHCRLFLKIRANLWPFSSRADALFTPVNRHSLAGQTAHLPLNNTSSLSFWHTVILPLFCLALFVSCVAEDPDSAESVPAPETTLKEAYRDAFLIGTALNSRQISGQDASGQALAIREFNAVTAENVMKWEVIHPEPGVYNFEAADAMVDLAEKNGMFIVGHTLVWHSQTPDWVFHDEEGNRLTREALLERMKEHIDTVVGRYRGRVHGWDVVNEALLDDGALRETLWYEIIGEDYLARAFEFAHEADPGAELYYNDYSLELPEKREGAIRLVQSLQEQGAPITGLGTQGHFSLDFPSLENLEATITGFAGLGVDVMVTELEIDLLPPAFDYLGADVEMSAELRDELNPYADGLPTEVQDQLTERYKEIFGLFLKHQDKISRVTFWGVTDGDSWKNNWPVPGRTNYPLLFDREGNPKPAYHALIELAER